MSKPTIVEIYFNLNTHKWSLRCEGKVVHHAKYAVIRPIKYHVGQSGRKRVVREKRKNVHAYIRGELLLLDKRQEERRNGDLIMYDPYAWDIKEEGFFFDEYGDEVLLEDYNELYFDFETKKVYGQ